ncbi:MAG TPA: flagellar protein FliT [Trinickia sp.]|jgi:hypothetical protein|nr:flagellar protein FliT [Trinickia sp.]
MSQESLTRAYELTRTLVVALEAGDLELAADLSNERAPLLMALTSNQTDEALAMIREILALNATIIDKAHAAREALTVEFDAAKRRIAAAGMYETTEKLR